MSGSTRSSGEEDRGLVAELGGGSAPRRQRVGTSVIALVVVVLLAVLAYVGGRSIYDRFRSAPDYSGSGSGTAYVDVQEGFTAADIGEALAKAGVVKSARAFSAAAKQDPNSLSIQPGSYRMRKHMSGKAALALLLDPASHVGRVTIAEGLNDAQTFAKLSAVTQIPVADFDAVEKNPSAVGLPDYAGGRLEGFVFPSTYNFPRGSTAVGVLKMMVAMQKAQVDPQTLRAGAAPLHLGPDQVIVVASLLEKEGITTDFPKIARVIYNRVERGMPLQLDSTVNYALGRNAARVSVAQTQVNSPYNTYLHKGLPPGAISNPGLQAIDAALHPAAGDWLYFIKADRAGHSFFTADPHAFAAQKRKSLADGIY